MQVWHALCEVDRQQLGPTVVTIGNFDGVHLGHRHVIEQARELAAQHGGLPVVAVSFEPHPLRVVAPDSAPVALTSLERRLDLLAAAGVDAALVLPFTAELAQLSAEDFVTTIVFETLQARGVVVGDNFRYGKGARGDVTLLKSLCDGREVDVVGVPLDGRGDQRWSSTYVRSCVVAGDVEAAAQALGRPYSIQGYVVRGEQRGRQLGYPTANVPVASTQTAIPADGVYAGWLRRLDEESAPWWPAAISVGTNPTFDGTGRRVESYVLDRDDLELYDALVEVAFVSWLRGMVKFDTVDALVDQMRDDVDQARDLLTNPPVRL
ncbi:MAG: bifunctional riboflavin kinase/FAD synthetase [Propionibacteriales bacterium]|nr:bifunctional riboflavin kinase/FAD synthetase [Propionibacteriales bacterium]